MKPGRSAGILARIRHRLERGEGAAPTGLPFAREALPSSAIVRVLIVKPSSLGDIIHGLVAAASLREQVPGVRIDWVAREVFAPIVRAASPVDRVFVFERKGGVRGFLRLVREIRATEYDLVLDMQGLARSALLARMIRAKRRIGRADSREGASLFVWEKAVPPPPPAHAVDILLGFLKKIGLRAEPLGRLSFPGAKLPEAVATLPKRRALVLFPDSRRPEKEWPHFQKLTALLLAGSPEALVVWAGNSKLAPDPAWPAEKFLNLSGKTTLPEAVALIEHAGVCVCNDSGPMHIAAAVGTPVVALFGPTDPALYGPFPLSRPSHRVLTAPDADLEKLSPEAVATECLRLIADCGLRIAD